MEKQILERPRSLAADVIIIVPPVDRQPVKVGSGALVQWQSTKPFTITIDNIDNTQPVFQTAQIIVAATGRPSGLWIAGPLEVLGEVSGSVCTCTYPYLDGLSDNIPSGPPSNEVIIDNSTPMMEE